MAQRGYGSADCPVCSTPFQKRRPNQKYDSEKCRHAVYNYRLLRALKGIPFPGPADLLIKGFSGHKSGCETLKPSPRSVLASLTYCNCGFREAFKAYEESLRTTVKTARIQEPPISEAKAS